MVSQLEIITILISDEFEGQKSCKESHGKGEGADHWRLPDTSVLRKRKYEL